MGKLEELGVVEVLWDEAEDGTVFAYGLKNYIIYSDNSMAVLSGADVTWRECVDFCHAVAMVYSAEAVCRWNLRDGKAKRADFNSDGGRTIDKIRSMEVDLYQAFDLYQKENAAHATDVENWDRFAEGLCQALGIMKGTSADQEWAGIEEKWKEVNEQKSKGEESIKTETETEIL